MAAKTSFPGSESEHTYVEPRTGTEVFVRRKGDLIQDVYTYRDAHFLRPIGRKGVYGIDPEFDNGRVARFLRWKTGRNDLFVHATHTGAAYDLLIQDHGFILIGEDDNNRVRGKSHLKEPQGPTRFGQEKSLADVRARITWEKWAAEKARQEGHEDLARGHDNAHGPRPGQAVEMRGELATYYGVVVGHEDGHAMVQWANGPTTGVAPSRLRVVPAEYAGIGPAEWAVVRRHRVR